MKPTILENAFDTYADIANGKTVLVDSMRLIDAMNMIVFIRCPKVTITESVSFKGVGIVLGF